MKYTGRYCPVLDQFDLQGEIDIKIDTLKTEVKDICSITENVKHRKEIFKSMIEYLLEQL